MDEQNPASSYVDYYNMIKAEHDSNNAWSAEQAQKAMDYQTQMSNTAHQREVADLKAAGLNPILSAGGSGATTGTGISAQRSDSNIDALYGLAKMAIENSMVQAQAMSNTAKYSSGHAGHSDPVSMITDSLDSVKNPIVNFFDGLFSGSGSSKSKSSSKKTSADKSDKDLLYDIGAALLLKGPKGVSTSDAAELAKRTVQYGKNNKAVQYYFSDERKQNINNAPNTYFEAVMKKGLDKIVSAKQGSRAWSFGHK